VNNLYKCDWLTHRNSPWSIAYFSRASTPLSDKQLYELVARAESRNHRINLCGVLLVRNNHFFQVLEGHVGFVSDLYQQIAADPRHTCVTKVLDAPIARPAFSGWHMRLITIEDISLEERDIVGCALDALERHAGDETHNLDLAALEACSNALVRGVYRRPIGAIAC